ncbi:hypothetical protein ABZP36_034848 [Zizania latifolia]
MVTLTRLTAATASAATLHPPPATATRRKCNRIPFERRKKPNHAGEDPHKIKVTSERERERERERKRMAWRLLACGCRRLLFLVVLGLVAEVHGSAGAGAASLPRLSPTEVRTLRRIAGKMGISRWNFSVDPCKPGNHSGFNGDLMCDCSFNKHTFCHVTNITLAKDNFTGELPPDFADLPNLIYLNLSRNLLHGGVPDQWAQMKLQILSLMANRLSGPFPMVLTKITTLTNLSIEGNNFYGPIPSEIGHLMQLKQLILSANEFSGSLPAALALLTNLTDLRISGNNFSGRLPDFLGKLMKLEKLQIEGSLLEGPIPSGFSKSINLSDLRISDLRGSGSVFPDLSGLVSMKTIILRNCSISGSIPSYIGNMKNLKHLDLTFNNLTGEIPASFANMGSVDYIYLTGNSLTGSIPEWILKRNSIADISFNNFMMGSSGPIQCDQGSVNLVESYSPEMSNLTNVQSCLKRDFPCAKNGQYRTSLHINCGDKEAIINGTTYEADKEPKGASLLYLSPGSNWAFSSTGNFMDNNNNDDNYITTGTPKLTMPNRELYGRARRSPLSLTYYGLCMHNGSYTVTLHFAEIEFTNDSTYYSLGKRRFNVFIQGRMVLEDFDIEHTAGASNAVIKTFTTYVTNHTLEIRFYWAGRGTTGIPERGYYGPLISAISVLPNFQVDTSKKLSPISKAFLIGMPILAIFTALFIAVYWIKHRRKSSRHKELRAFDLQLGSFTLRQIKAATGNFDVSNKIGEGGFGSVYKGLLSDGTIIAVKQLSSRSRQGNREFLNEIGMISALQHPNLVKLYGCCAEGNQLLLVYEYMENNCLARALFVFPSTYLGMILSPLNVLQACVLHERGTLLELVDPDLGSDYSAEEALLMLNVALLCTNAAPTLRPKMTKVVSLLEGQTPLQPFLSDLSLAANSLSSSGLRRNFWQNPSESQSMTLQASCSNSNESSSLDIDGSLRPLVSYT